MKRGIFFLLLFTACFCVKAQIFIPQLYQGQNINQVIYNGTYTSTGSCSGTDYDFDLEYALISPFATGVELSMEITSLSGSLTLNGNAVSEGNTFNLTEPVVPMHFQFTGAGSVDFSVWATGTPTVASEVYPCYVIDKVATFACNNYYKLMEGEIFVPCSVSTATGISENQLLQNLFFNAENQTLFAETKTEDELIITDMLGKIILSQALEKGNHLISLPQISEGIYVARL